MEIGCINCACPQFRLRINNRFEDEDDDEYEDEADAKWSFRLLHFVESICEVGSQIFQVFNAYR